MRAADTLTVILRSVCVGIAAVVFAAIGSMFIGTAVAVAIGMSKPSPSPEVGWEVSWDLITILHNHPSILLGAGVVFAVGFAIGFRYFSKRLIHETPAQ